MKVELLEFVEDVYNFKLGNVDIKVTYEGDKWEIFRNLSYFQKEQSKWCNFPNIKRNEEWVPLYDRNPPVSKEILTLAVKEVDDFLLRKGTYKEDLF